jgi:hypothetical protein
VSARFLVAALGLVPFVLAMACSSSSRPSETYAGTPPVTSGRDAGCDGTDPFSAPPGPDAEGLCGNVFLPAIGDPPNIYFVIDRSGSMQEIVDGLEKYAAVSKAAVDLVRKIGSKANFGAAVFPAPEGAGNGASCLEGHEVFATHAGDVSGAAGCSSNGPVTRGFAGAIALPSRIPPAGGTPTASTLRALVPTLASLPGKTAVVLATDGGPNCNEAASCDAAHCIPNIEHAEGCDSAVNCCTADGGFTAKMCLDDEPTKTAVAQLREHGIATYVIGIPGSAPYRALLDDLARAGGTARAAEPAYYDVASLTELDQVLAAIGGALLLSCHLTIEKAPPDPTEVRVYLDKTRLTYGSPDGWAWSPVAPDAGEAESGSDGSGTSDAGTAGVAIDLRGTACSDLLSGRVREVQVVSGCPPEIPR